MRKRQNVAPSQSRERRATGCPPSCRNVWISGPQKGPAVSPAGRVYPVASTAGARLYLEGEMECGLMAHKFHRGFTAAVMRSLEARVERHTRYVGGTRTKRRDVPQPDSLHFNNQLLHSITLQALEISLSDIATLNSFAQSRARYRLPLSTN